MKLNQFCNKAIILEDLKRFFGLSILYFIALFVSGPLYAYSFSNVKSKHQLRSVVDAISGLEAHGLIAGAAGILLGVLLFRYLHNKNSVAVIHGYPFRRSELLNSHVISGIILLSIPIVLNSIVFAVVLSNITLNIDLRVLFGNNVNIEEIASLYSAKQAIYWFLKIEIISIVFFLISVFAATISGVTIIQGALSSILPFVPFFIIEVVDEALGNFVFGFRSIASDSFTTKIIPIPVLRNNISQDLNYVVWYICLCILLYGVSLWLYKRRDLEKSQDTIVFDILKPIFTYGVTFCTMLLAGGYFYSLKQNTLWLWIGGFIGSFLGYFVSQMTIKKSLRVFRSLKGYIVYLIVIGIVIIGIKVDLLGYERRIPDQDQIKKIYFDNLQRSGKGIVERESIESVIAIHRMIIDNKKDIIKAEFKAQNQRNYSEITYITIGYLYDNGKKVSRRYRVPKSLLANNAPTKQLYESKEYKEISNKLLLDLDLEKVNTVNISGRRSEKRKIISDKDEIKELFEVLRKEVLEEPYESMIDRNEWATIEFDTNSDAYDYGFSLYLADNMQQDVHVAFKRAYSNLEKWFIQKGYLKDIRILPEEIEYIVIQKANKDYSDSYSSDDIEQDLIIGNSERVEIKDKQIIEEILRTTDTSTFSNNNYNNYIVAIYTKSDVIHYGWYNEENASKYLR
ncbi:DUF6449 domain-containing protein [Wukongibacter baidiensis]|uniref:DUF6449 domain-containing protein n=1 Tax=Wukongibacter baidiensis TaxID=1723361 RepID=UPI003D7F81D8